MRVIPSVVYPVWTRQWPAYNDPVVELVHQAALAEGRPVSVIDVGAAMGDTALLLHAMCPDDISALLCVEADDLFVRFLSHNVRGVRGATYIHAALGDGEPIPALIRDRRGTAIAAGAVRTPSKTLDDVVSAWGESPDVLKIDTDGSDGRILAGAQATLDRYRPAVIFEWDPGSFLRTGADWREPFEVLAATGYSQFVWFTKYGEFSHFMLELDRASIVAQAEFCLSTRARHEWHYDVAALPSASRVSLVNLADLAFAKHRKLVALT
jgi:FkbM family methyltransferase